MRPTETTFDCSTGEVVDREVTATEVLAAALLGVVAASEAQQEAQVRVTKMAQDAADRVVVKEAATLGVVDGHAFEAMARLAGVDLS